MTGAVTEDAVVAVAVAAVANLRRLGLTVATAESLTGGLVCAALTAVPGASAVVRGGVVAYATDVKRLLVDVPAETLGDDGPVSVPTALAMASGARCRFGADVGVATTGVAGPDQQDGHPPGTVHVALVPPAGVVVRSSARSEDALRDGAMAWSFTGSDRIPGDRAAVRRSAVAAALTALAQLTHEADTSS